MGWGGVHWDIKLVIGAVSVDEGGFKATSLLYWGTEWAEWRGYLSELEQGAALMPWSGELPVR